MSLKDRLAALTPEQRRELAQRLKQQQEQQAPAQKPAQPARAKVGVFPLSENQWSMWFLHQLAPQSPSYNVALAMRVRGPVDPAMLERSLNLLAERHAILRTTYETQDEKPVQRVHARLPLALTRHDAPGMTEEQLDGQLRASYLRPFDLEHGPVWRADLFTRAPTEHVLLLVIHHIATDLWSMGMMMEELQHLYRGELRGEPVRLPPLKLDYVDSVQLRREQMTPARQEQLWEYWQSQMKELPGPLELPTDMPRPARWSFRGTTLPMRLGPELSAGLKTLARNEGKTLYTVLLAAFLTLVHRYTGQSDILCGSPLWGRTHPDVQRLAGYFVNFVALRGDMSGDPPFTELMDRLYRRVLGAIENQDYPFHVLCERLGVKQDPSRPRLVEVEFSFDQFNSMPGLDVARDDVQMELKPFLRQQEGQFAINLMLVDVAGEVAGALKYNTDLFTPETMARFAAQLRVLLTSVLRNPRQRLSALSLLTDTDRRQLLETFNTTAQTFPPRASVQSLFEEHAARAPEKPAVACEGRRLSYGELNARANQLAWRLRELGVGPETCVALCLDRSVEMVESILGTWKAGGAYVPLDPALPAERLRTLVEEVAAPVVVTESAKAEVFASLPVRVVCLDTEGAALAALPTHTPPCELHADNVAYVLFTSGSTGRPKGVAVAHGHLLNYIQSVIERLDLGACESFAMVSTFAADLGNTVLFPALCLGGFLHVMSKDRASSPQGMADYFRQHGVDCLKIVPSHLAALMTASEPRDVLPRKRLVVGGEASTWALVERVRTLMPSCEVYNHYGPTETTVGVVCGRAESQKPELAQATVPLGRPIANTRLYVLDAGLRPTPLGVPGELYISGDSVTRGYLGRPDQTADRFMPDPFSPKPGARMYRTGDRARWLADGRVEFLGRADFQVKIRGFRVELGEIEATLRVLPSVKEAVVLALGETSDTRRLVAYLTGQAGAASVEVEAVRRGLRERLPEYMVPSAFVALDALPLTPNGKLDRKALPVPEAAPVLSAEGYVAPRTPTEEILVGLFAQVLSLPAVGVHDDFFAVGGHSLLAMRLVSRLRSALGVEVPLRGLFEAPTAAKLAVRIAELQRQGGGVQVPPVLRVAREGHSPVSFAQQRLWFLDQLMPGQTSYNVPIVLRLTGALDVETLRRTMEEVVRRHESLRTTFTSLEGQPYQVIHPMARLELPVVSLEHLPAAEREAEALRLSTQEVGQPFDLARGPLQRARLLRLGDTEYVLAMAVHHIVSDGWSLGVMVRELVALYEAFSEGKPPPLPELPVQYADYAHWQRGWMAGPVLEQQLEYWRKALAGVTPLELPTDKPRPAMQSYRGATLAFALPRPLAEGLKGLARQEGATLFMVLLGAFQVLLHRYSGQDDITVGTPVAGRNQPELEGLIGFFVNTLALRTRLGGNPLFREVLAQVKETTLGAYAHQDIPFEKLVEALEPERELSRQPLFQVAFMLQNAPASDLSLPGVAVRRELVDTHSAKFDLSLSLTETAEGLSGLLEYSTDLYEAGTVERMLGHYQRLLESLAVRPQARIDEVVLLGEAEREQVLLGWNTLLPTPEVGGGLHELFEAQVEATPEAVALVVGEKRLTYRQVEERANQLAWLLRGLGVGPEVRVGVSLERTEELVVALLGILKAGGAYVPLDPAYPAERLALMLEDARSPVLVTQRKLEGVVAAGGAKVVWMGEGEEVRAQKVERPARVTQPGHLAYVLYTSGSTGRPKGVALEHRSAVAFLQWALATFSRAQLQGVLGATSVNFDLSVFELFAPLSCGGRVYLAENALGLAGLPAAGEVTLVNTVPSAMAELVRQGAVPASVKTVNLAGEALPSQLVEGLYGLGSVEAVYNLYGPTEDTTYSTWALAPKGAGVPPPIGRPLAGTQAYVVDAQLKPVPVGVPGELYLAGVGLARGYLGRPELTAERFVPNPFSEEPGARMYRTGDRVKWRADGQLEYLGRIDFQVKVRGFRIELGEVEEGLRRHPGVQEAVVVARGEGGDKKLVGYVSVKAGQQVEAAELQELLKQHLPRFMVPSVLVVLAAMPLNPNGKIDRKALPEPDMQGAGQEYVAPSTPTEELLASVWMQVLKVARAGRDDDFFALGGHSLVATQVVSRVRTQCGVELPLRAVFEAPVLRELAARIDALGKGRAAPPLKRVARDGKLPLSFAQQRLWFLDQMEPGSASYNIPFAVRLRGEMDAAALEKSLAEVVRRHEALRTTFEEVDGQPVQHIQPAGSFRLNVEDVSHLPEAQREAAARQRVEQEARRPFDLGRELMLKALLVKVAPTEGVLVVNMHHIASDGWSLGVFVKELVALYEAYSEGKAAGLEELPVQYADYAVWQREWLQGEVLEEQVEYWRQKLAGVAPLELPTDKPRPAVQTYRGATVPVKLPSVLAKRVREVAQQEGVTPFMLLLAVWQTLLGRYSGQQDVSVGMPIAGRRQAEVEGLIGFFVNTLVVRAQVEGAKSFRELLAQVKETTLGAYAHQDVPFEKLVEELRPERDLGRAPLFQVMFSLQNAPMPELEVKGLTLRLEELSRQHSKFDLSLALTESAEGLDGLLEYSTDLYEAGSVERMAHHFQVLLESALARPEARVSELRLLDEAERRQVLVEWNATGATYPRDSSVHAVFEAQVDLTPDAVAVVDGGEVLTYAQLERRANQLAQFLRSQGLTLEERVGLCLERSADLIVAMLGVLKAGGVYVPLDSAYPADRLGFMVADSHVRLLVTHGTLAQGLDTSGLTVVRMDEDRATLDAASAERPRGAVSALGLAYVIYTSGSTGRPKGVEVEHRPIVRLVKGTDFAQIQSEDRMAQLSNTSFDAATFEVWGALLNGAALVVVPREVALVPAELTHLLREQRITAMFLTTSLFNQVARELPDAFETITHVVIGGEAADPVSVRRVLAAKPPRRLVNGYGPTETTTFATWHLMNDVAEGVTSIPIGRPLKNSTGYVLDRNLNLVPVGVPGELYVGGDGVGRGYQARPELTAEKFMPDPFSAEPGARMYRTGDRARLRADGVIEYLGRQDQQVKLRGFRIELEEISAALQAHAGVKDAVALVREVSPGDKRLVAYVIPTGEEAPAPAELKVHLARTLPDYMVPSAYVVLKAWPLTPNGKLDRAALPAPTGSDAGVGEADNAPRTPVEETLTKIFAEVLGVERVGRGDDFFELGGHSLLATRLVSRVRSGLRVELPLRALFESRTPERLAARVETLVQQAAGAKVPPLKRAAREGKLPLSFAQQRLWFLDQMEPGSASYNIPFAVTLRGAVDAEALEKSLAEVVRRHEALRTTFEEVDGQPVQHIQPAGSFRLERADVSHLPEAQREAAARQHVETAARKPFHLGRELMLKALLVKVGPAERVLVVNMHHIASDGWSLGVFVKELAALYEAYSEGKEAALPELPVQYADYAVWQRGWLKDEVLGEQVEYWRQKLAGVAPLELPTDKPRPAVQTYRGATVPVKLPGALSKQVVALAQQEGVTPFMLLLAAWQTLLGRYSGQQDVSVGMPIAGRRQAEVEGLIGFFVNTLVVRTQVEGTKSFRELLAQVKEAALGAYAHQDVPFEKLVEELKPERNLGRAPLFQVMFSLQNASMPELEVKGLTLRQVDVKRDTAKFDLSLALTDTAEGLHGSLEYSTDLYEAGTVERMVRHFQVLLESVVARPEARVGELALLEAAERQQVLVAWNPTRVESSSVACVQELFEAQADRTPDVLAVACGGQSLTYRQLDQRANRLANRLRRLGVGPEARVGLWMERSVDLVVGMLATLKAGGAYVPVDADYPEARARLLLEDSGLSVLVSEQSLLKRLSSLPGGAVALALDTEDLGAESDARPARVTTPDNAAYVIYTSGSTGRPKGVVVEHRHLWHLLRWHLEAYSVKPGDRASQVASPAFDAAVWEIWPYLVSGAALDLPDRDTRLEPARLVAWLVERGITVAFLPTPLCEAVLAEPWPAETRLRWLLTGGDKLSRRPSPDAPFRLVNHYGPTEATVVATAGEVLATGSGRDPSIGGPISHARIYVLDEHQAPQPVGVPGELYVAGAGVARGYLERPEQTAERFVLDPFSEEPGARMYRTGDRVRWLTDGTLEFLGRMDFQVKIRGYRIELGEIEAVLSQQPAVLHAVVVVRQAVGRPQRLVAYVVPRQGQTVDTEALRAFLQSRLPEYMVPAAFLVLEALPLTPNGKVDRKALPEPEDRGSEQAFVAPLTPTETVLAELWAQVLSVPRVGRHESFFELGGHSLMATQVMARIRGAWGVELPLRAMFEAPTLEALAARIDQAKSGPGRKVPALEPVRRDGPLPLSFAQQRLWFLDQLESGSASYNIPLAVRFEGVLDAAVLEKSLGEVVRRHEALRTTFALVDGQAVQRVQPAEGFVLHVENLSGLPAARREEEARARVGAEARRPFDLGRDLMLRASLLRLAEREHVLVVNMHHIASDGWSVGVLMRELAALYEAHARGQQATLPELSVQYADYAVWQRGWLKDEVLGEQVAYWKQKLAGAAPLELPTDKPRPATQTYRGAALAARLPRELSQRLNALARQEGVTPFMLLLAAWQVLLHRYSGQQDISVGMPIAGRRQAEVEGLIGFFVNTLVVRAQVEGAKSFRELLAQVKETTLGAYAHQDVPFEKLVEELRPERDLGRTPLFQVMFSLQNAPMPELEVEGLKLRPVEVRRDTAKFDLSLFLHEDADGLRGSLEYSTDLYEAGTVERMLGHYQRLLESVVEKPEACLDEVVLLGEAEREQVLKGWNTLLPTPEVGGGLHELFEAQVEATPEAVALVVGEKRLTYRQVEERANQLAWLLRGLGVGPEVRVGVSLERTEELVVALLGILKAGGAYVPLDPAYPAERLALMLEDARSPVLVTQRKLEGVVAAGGAKVVWMGEGEEVRTQKVERPARVTQPGHLAYVLYTSGSTGRPKGVALEHRSAVAFLQWALATFSRQQLDGMLGATSVNFDLSVFELFAPLSCGGRVYLAENALGLAGLAAAGEVTLVNTVPSAMAELVRQGAVPASVKTVNLAGEALPSQLVEGLYGLGSVEAVYNLYGPTEDTTYSTWALAPKGAGVPPPIGRPLAGTQAYVVDARLEPVPVGVPGELYLAGVGLARGYLGRPELTAERFVPNPFSEEPGARMYRTGDRVKWRADGQLEYLGRIDFQVKVRGFRIELGEVEEGLRRHPGVQEAVVVAKGEGGDKKLVGYVSVKAGQQVEAAELQELLKQHLPRFMVPSVLVVLQAMPLNPNGKIDRKALPEPEWSRGHEGEVALAPRDRTELELASIFGELLGVRSVGVRDDFFALGGHSLLTVRLVAQIERRLGRKLPLNRLFGNATIESLAAVLRDAPAAGASSPLATLQPRGNLAPLFLVHAIGGSALSFRELSQALGEEQPLHAFHAPGLEGEAPPFEDISAMARHYLAPLREARVPGAPLWLAGWSFGGLVAYEMARQLEAEGVDVAGVILLDSWLPRRAWPVQPDGSEGVRHLARELGLEVEGDATLARLAALAVERRLLPPATAEDDLGRALRVYEAHQAAFRAFRPQPSKGLRLVLLRPEQVSSPADAALLEQDATGGWGALVPGPVELHAVPGDHFRMLRAPHIESLAQVLRDILRPPRSTQQPEVA